MVIRFNKIKLSEGVKSSISLFVASMITSGISYLVTPIYTRMLPETVYGQASIFMTWLSLLGIVSMFGLSNGVFNNGMSDYPNERDEYSFSILVLSNIITICTGIIYIGISKYLTEFSGLSIKYFYLMIAVYIFQPAYLFWSVRQRYEYKYKGILVWSIVCAVISPLIAIVLITYAKEEALLEARVFGAEIPLICVYMIFYIYLGVRSKGYVNTKFWGEALKFNLPLLSHYLSMYILNSSDKIMISRLVGDAETAYYSVAYSVSAIASIVWTAINASLIPYTYEKCKRRDYSKIREISKPIMLSFFIVCVLVILLSPEVVAFMASDNYMEAIYVVPPVVGGVFFQIQYFLYANILYFYKATNVVMYGSVASAVLNLFLNYFFIIKYGYIAAGFTTLVCFMLQSFIDYLGMRKVTKEDIYDFASIRLLSVIMIITVIMSEFIYNWPIVRFGLALILFVGIFIKRKYILEVLRTLKKN